MDTEYIDIRSLSIINDSISEIAGIPFSIFDSNGKLLLPAKMKDKSSYVEFQEFISSCIEKVIPKQEPIFLKDLSGNDYIMIPFNFNGTTLAAVSRADSMERLRLQNISAHLKKIFEILISLCYEKSIEKRKYQWAKAIINIASDITTSTDIKDVYSSLLDALMFLFDIKTVAILIKEGDEFKTVAAIGDIKSEVSNVVFHSKNPLIASTIEGCKPLSTNDFLEIEKLGLPDKVAAVNIFPLMDRSDVYGLLTIYNSLLSKHETYGVLDVCKVICMVIKNLCLQNNYNRCFNDLIALHTAIKKVTEANSRDDVYEAIVNAATELLNAERGSLMIPNSDDLVIKAVKGINKWLVQDIKIKIGEGVAGRVFKDGKPFFVRNIETLPDIKPRRHYKTHSFISMPMTFASEVKGVLNVTDKITGDEFTEKDLSLLDYFSSYASMVLKAKDYQAMADQMKEFAITDYLTGLFNRRYLYEYLTEEIHRSRRYNFVFSLIMFDIDNFKLFNDSEGHIAGDNILKAISRLTKECLRTNDILARFGGEEFAILMPQTGKEEAHKVAERIRKNIRENIPKTWTKFPYPYITVSFGISFFPECGEGIDDLIKSADYALYEAKKKGKDTIAIYKSD